MGFAWPNGLTSRATSHFLSGRSSEFTALQYTLLSGAVVAMHKLRLWNSVHFHEVSLGPGI